VFLVRRKCYGLLCADAFIKRNLYS